VASKIIEKNESENVAPIQIIANVVPIQIIANVVPIQIAENVVPIQITANSIPIQIIANVVPIQIAENVVPIQIIANVVPIQITANAVASEIIEKIENENFAPIEIIEGAAVPILTNEQNETVRDIESVHLLSSDFCLLRRISFSILRNCRSWSEFRRISLINRKGFQITYLMVTNLSF
jgi:hypothetical protein